MDSGDSVESEGSALAILVEHVDPLGGAGVDVAVEAESASLSADADLGAGFEVAPGWGDDGGGDCPPVVDEWLVLSSCQVGLPSQWCITPIVPYPRLCPTMGVMLERWIWRCMLCGKTGISKDASRGFTQHYIETHST